MNAVEFDGALTSGQTISVPAEVARELPAASHFRVILLWDGAGDPDWRRLTMERFAAAYAPEDSVYEALAHEPPSR